MTTPLMARDGRVGADGGGPAPPTTPARAVWTRWRFWAAVLVVLVLGAVVVGLLGRTPHRPLDPTSAQPDGSKALARVLAEYGTRVTRTSDPQPGGTVVVTDPDAFSDGQLRRLASGSQRVVLVRPGVRSSRAVLPGFEPDANADISDTPGCTLRSASAAGTVDLPADATAYVSNTSNDATVCYDGAVVSSGNIVVLGSVSMLENRALGRVGVAALDVNAISADRSTRSVRWLVPGASAGGAGEVTIWTLFPPGAHRVALWLVLVALVAVVWRARRLGPPVTERLPVVVRASEIVEGHGRLYERAGARDRAAAALRSATTRRLTGRLALARDTSPTELVAALSARLDRPPGPLWALLAGPPPADDAALARLARDLDELETATRGTT